MYWENMMGKIKFHELHFSINASIIAFISTLLDLKSLCMFFTEIDWWLVQRFLLVNIKGLSSHAESDPHQKTQLGR